MGTQDSSRRLLVRWATRKGLSAIIAFLVVAVLAEYVVVAYAMSLGLQDGTALQWSFLFPGTNWNIVVTINPLFHLVPIAVIVSLLFTWVYLTRSVAVKPYEVPRIGPGPTYKRAKQSFFSKLKTGFLRIKAVSYVWQKIHFARATIRSAFLVLMFFLLFTLVASLLVYPDLIFNIITTAYRNNPGLLDFVKGTGQALSPIGAFFAPIGNALIAIAPAFRDVAAYAGGALAPLASLDNVGKYVVFQNVAAWVAGLTALFYGNYVRKVYRYRRVRKS